MVQVIRVPDTAPVMVGVVVPPSSDSGLVATSFAPSSAVEGASVLSVVMPEGGTSPGGTVDPAFRQQVLDALDGLDGRLDTLEAAPSPAPSGPAGGDLTGEYPNPVLAQSYALSGPTTSALSTKAPRFAVRPISSSTTAGKFEHLAVTTGTSVVTIAPPANLAAGDEIFIQKVDAGSGTVVFNDDTNSDATTTIQGQWSGATLVFTDPNWVVKSVSAAYSAAPTSGGGGSGGFTREQADARYDPLGAASAALAGVTKTSIGLGNVQNYTPTSMPISDATQAALNAKQPLQSPYVQAGGGTYTVNAANGSVQSLTATSNVVLQPPANPSDQQSLRLEIFASGANRTVTTVGGIVNASNLPLPCSIAAGRCGWFSLLYSTRSTRWTLVTYVIEPGS